MKFEPPFDRPIPEITTAPPFGRSPDGQWIVSAADLPRLPIPKHAVVTKDFIEFDGWVFPLSYVTKDFLVWLQQTLIRWTREDDSQKNKEWINGIVEAFQDGIAGNL